jgi:phosphoesterase RecJ-like protein
MLNELSQKILSARSVVLSTHRNSDGDGLGAELALLFTLRKIGVPARILNVDSPGKKYSFLLADEPIQSFDRQHEPLAPTDLGLIFDTNDGRLLEPLFSHLLDRCREVLFIDHHPILERGPQPTRGSWIDVDAASTGELSFRLIKKLLATKNLELDAQIARALYTSVVFDTQLFRFVRSLPNSHLMAAELLRYEKNPEEIHRHLFATYSLEKMKFLTLALNRVDYEANGRLAFIYLDREALAGLPPDDSGDVIDMVMNIETIEAAALLREDAPGQFKLSLRSKGKLAVLPIAEQMGGGGHQFAAGAYLEGADSELRRQILSAMKTALA